MSVDPFEANNVVSQNQVLVNDLAAMWETWRASDEPTQQDVVAPVEGCLDTTAGNWDPLANQSDGSCEYTSVGKAELSGPFSYSPLSRTLRISKPGYHAVTLRTLQGRLIFAKKGFGKKDYQLDERIGTGLYLLQVTVPDAGRISMVFVE